MKEMVKAKDKRINNLSTIKGCTAQMRTVYRLARKNLADELVDPQSAKVLVDILKTITAAYRESELESRIEALENAATKKSR